MGDDDAFERIAGEERRYLFHLLYALCGDRFDAEDLVQESLLRAYEKWETFRGESSVRTWLTRIALNIFRASKRKVPVHRSISLATLTVRDPLDEPERTVIFREFQWCVYHNLYHHVPLSYRTALVLRDLHGMSYRDLALVLGCSEQAARLRVHRGRQRFRQCFADDSCFAFRRDYRCICEEVQRLSLESLSEMEKARRILQAVNPPAQL